MYISQVPGLRQICLLITLVFCSQLVFGTSVATSDETFHDASRARQLAAYIWYPSDVTAGEAAEITFAENAVFYGFKAFKDGPVSEGKFPLVVLSHGSGGNRASQGWLAVELARQGAVVVAFNHPGSTTGDSKPDQTIKIWERPQDIRFVLDQLLVHGKFSKHLDKSRIAVIGHSLGGYTALALAGAKVSLDRFIYYCGQHPLNSDCQFYRNGNVELADVDRSQFEGDHSDPRVSAVVALDPALALAYDTTFAKDAAASKFIIGAGEAVDEVGSLGVSKLLADHPFMGHTLAEANHFSFLQLCKPKGHLVLREEGEEYICRESRGRSRSEIHESVAHRVVEHLRGQGFL